MKRYTVLAVKNFPELLKGVANASSDKGYQLWITNRMKKDEVTCAICATHDGIIQGKGVFYAKLMMIEVDEDGQERKVQEPSGWSGKYSMPLYFADTVFSLGEDSESMFFSIYEKEMKVSNHVAEVKIPFIRNFEMTKSPDDLTVSKFAVDRKTLRDKVRKILAGSLSEANDTFSFRVSDAGQMEMMTCTNYLIPKETMQVSKIETEEKKFNPVDMCSVSTKKLYSLCSIEAEKVEFTVYMDERNYGRQVMIKLDKKTEFLLNTKINPPASAFTLADRVSESYLYRMKVNAKDIRKALNILLIGQKDEIIVDMCPVETESGEGYFIIRDLNSLRKVKIPFGEMEGTIPEEEKNITTKFRVLNASCAPFDEIIHFINTGDKKLLMTEGSCNILSTFAEVPNNQTSNAEEEVAEVTTSADDGEVAAD